MKPQPRYKPGDKIGGRYQVHQALMGGMGEVYLCLDLETIQPYALKTFQQRYLTNPKLRTAFDIEVGIWVTLGTHTNIVRCFHLEVIENKPFMILEWIAGEDLRQWIRRGPLDLRRALTFAIDICRGLIHAQQSQPGIIHRDLKPENILIAHAPVAKITDFGLAKIAMDARLNIPAEASNVLERKNIVSTGGLAGTPHYMAPEQWSGEKLDARTDIYAIGCILYEMLTGYLPFKAFTLDDLRSQHMDAPIPTLMIDAAKTTDLNSLIPRCMAKQPNERFATVDDLHQELSCIFEHQFSEKPRSISVSRLFKSAEYSEQFTSIDHNNRGNAYAFLKRYNEALADYDRAIQLEPDDAVAYINRGDIYLVLTQNNNALDDYNRAIELDSSNAIAYSRRADAYNNSRKFKLALIDLNKAIQLDPNLVLAYHVRGNTYIHLEQYDKALTDYSQAIRLDPTDAKAYTKHGLIYQNLQKYNEALADFNQAIQLDPNLALAYAGRGSIYTRLERFKEALSDINQAIQLDSANIAAFNNRGNVYVALGRFEEALNDYSCAIQLDPSYAEAYINRGIAYHRLHQREKALADLNQAIQLDPNSATAYSDCGNIYAALGRYDDALADFSRAIRLDPTNAIDYNNRGLSYVELQRYDEALVDFNQAVRLDPNLAEIYFNLANTYRDLEQYDKALRNYSRAIQLDRTDAQAYFNIGDVFGRRGRLRKALPYFETAAQLGHPIGEAFATRFRKKLEMEFLPRNPFQLAFEAFQEADSDNEMRRIVVEFPIMTTANFIASITQTIVSQVPPEHKPALVQRLTWLRQIADDQNRKE